MSDRQRVVMVATSYPRFEGDTVGTFMQPIAAGLAARGHEVHMVLPWHPRLERRGLDHGVHFHAFHYAPLPSWHVFGYAGALRADVQLRATALAVTPIAVLAGWRLAARVAREIDATIVHGHWVVPGGVMARAATGPRPLVVSLHGSDVYVAERHALVGAAARRVFARADAVVACSDDLRTRALGLGADEARSETIPYGVDTERFAPDPDARRRVRAAHGFSDDDRIVFAIGRFVRKKGFEYLVDAVARLGAGHPRLRLVLAGWGDLEGELRARIAAAGIAGRVTMPGLVPHETVPQWLAAADMLAVPSVRDEAGNVDGLPNVLLEGLASATPVVATRAGGIAAAVADGTTGLLVAERDAGALADAIERLLVNPSFAAGLGAAARAHMRAHGTWTEVARRLEDTYARAAARRTSRGRRG